MRENHLRVAQDDEGTARTSVGASDCASVRH